MWIDMLCDQDPHSLGIRCETYDQRAVIIEMIQGIYQDKQIDKRHAAPGYSSITWPYMAARMEGDIIKFSLCKAEYAKTLITFEEFMNAPIDDVHDFQELENLL